jgi:hypothetical protein
MLIVFEWLEYSYYICASARYNQWKMYSFNYICSIVDLPENSLILFRYNGSSTNTTPLKSG